MKEREITAKSMGFDFQPHPYHEGLACYFNDRGRTYWASCVNLGECYDNPWELMVFVCEDGEPDMGQEVLCKRYAKRPNPMVLAMDIVNDFIYRTLRKAKIKCFINGSPASFEALVSDFAMAWMMAVEKGHDQNQTLMVIWL